MYRKLRQKLCAYKLQNRVIVLVMVWGIISIILRSRNIYADLSFASGNAS